MKMNTEFDEDVSGRIVGSYTLMGSLHYEGRKQGNTIYAWTEDALHTAANEYVRQQRQECGTAFRDIYPKDAWELRIHVA